MAMVLDIQANLKVVKDNIKKVVEDAMSSIRPSTAQGSAGGGAGGESKAGKKQGSLLGGIIKKLAPLAILLSMKPVAQLLELLVGVTTFAFLKLLKFFGFLGDEQTETQKKLGDWGDKIDDLTNVSKEQKEDAKRGLGIVNGILEWTKNLFPILGKILDWGGGLGAKMGEWFATNWENIKQVGILVWDSIKDWAVGLWDSTKEIAVQIWDKIKGWTQDMWGKTKDFAKDLWEKIKVLPQQIWDKMKEWGKEVIDWLKALPGDLAIKIKEAIGSIFTKDKNADEESVDDAIITKDGKIIRTNPNDTLIATQTPGQGTGGARTLNFYGVQPQEVIDLIKREMGTEVTGGNRF